MQGASPLASPRLTPRGTGSLCRCGKLNGGLPRAALARPANPAPGGGRRGAVARRPCRCGVCRGACLLCRLPTLPLAYFSAPLPRRGRIDPQPPSRREGGDFRLFYARGFAPCIPGAEPGRRRLDRRRRRHAYEPGRRWLRAGNRASGGGLVCFTRRIYFWRIIRILPLSPRPPSPLGKGETLYFISPGADAPGTPA